MYSHGLDRINCLFSCALEFMDVIGVDRRGAGAGIYVAQGYRFRVFRRVSVAAVVCDHDMND